MWDVIRERTKDGFNIFCLSCSFRHVRLEMPVGLPSRDGELAWRQVQCPGINLRANSMFKVIEIVQTRVGKIT